MTTTTPTDFGAWVLEQVPATELALEKCCAVSSLSEAPASLRQAVEYALRGGKHLRPALVRLSCEAHGGDFSLATPAAVACEMIHAYSLVHDDLPCMDDDALRRGRPSVHAAFGVATAVLAGDALQALAFEILASQKDPRLVQDQLRYLSVAAGPAGMVGGQMLDLASSADDPVETVRENHRRKTGDLICAALHLGVRAAGADPSAWTSFSGLCGELFQAVDDVLDATSTTQKLGKTVGKDAASGRGNLVAALGLDGARREARQLAAAAQEAAVQLPVTRHFNLLTLLPAWFEERCS